MITCAVCKRWIERIRDAADPKERKLMLRLYEAHKEQYHWYDRAVLIAEMTRHVPRR